MANSYYNASGAPSQGSAGSSATIRGEFNAIVAGFDKMPALGGNGGHAVFINAGATGLESNSALSASGSTITVTGDLAVTGALALANLVLTGNLTVQGNTTIGNAGADTLTIVPNAVTWSGNPTHSGNHTYSGAIRLSAGSAGAPSLAISGDTDTGMYSGGANILAFSTAGSMGFRINGTPGVHVGDSGVDAASSSVGLYNRPRLAASGVSQYGVFENTMFSSSVTSSGHGFYAGMRFADGAYVTINAFNFRATDPTLGAGQTLTNAVGFYCDDLTVGTTNRAFRGLVTSGANKWNAYMDGSAQNYFAGNVGIGSGKSAPAVALDVAGEFALTSSLSTAMLTLENTNAGLNGVMLESYANSASPGNGDELFQLDVYGEDDSGAKLQYGQLYFEALNVGVGATHTGFYVRGRQGGTLIDFLRINNSQAFFPTVGTTASAANAFLNSGSSPANQLLRSTSSIRYKADVLDLPDEEALAVVSQMRPVTYRSAIETDDQSRRWLGFIAEELAVIDPRLVHFSRDESGRETPDGVQYERVTVLLAAAVQEALRRLDAGGL
jgi:hypothetical protein